MHLVPYFNAKPIEQIDDADLERFMAALRRSGCSPKTIKNIMGTLHSIFDHALRRRWVVANPCKLVEKPKGNDADPDIRFLDQAELEAVLRAVPDDHLGRSSVCCT